jgi:hypothetical protein
LGFDISKKLRCWVYAAVKKGVVDRAKKARGFFWRILNEGFILTGPEYS